MEPGYVTIQPKHRAMYTSPECMLEAGAAKRSHAEGMDSWLVGNDAIGASIIISNRNNKSDYFLIYQCPAYKRPLF